MLFAWVILGAFQEKRGMKMKHIIPIDKVEI